MWWQDFDTSKLHFTKGFKFAADLVTFTEEIHNGKLRFLCSADFSDSLGNSSFPIFPKSKFKMNGKMSLQSTFKFLKK